MPTSLRRKVKLGAIGLDAFCLRFQPASEERCCQYLIQLFCFCCRNSLKFMTVGFPSSLYDCFYCWSSPVVLTLGPMGQQMWKKKSQHHLGSIYCLNEWSTFVLSLRRRSTTTINLWLYFAAGSPTGYESETMAADAMVKKL